MTLVVPFDGSELSKTALVRAAQFDAVLDLGVVAVSVVPRNNKFYARKRGWIGSDESFDRRAVVDSLKESANKIAPDAEFNHISVGRNSPSGTISNKIRRFARDKEASIVFVGSKDAGRLTSSLSVGSSVTSDRSYDTMIISNTRPTQISELEEAIPTKDALE
jgi:nucleotide-binding universal stress UspA family protein